jgi:hypothetical protein
MGGRTQGGWNFLQPIQQLGQPSRIAKKEPSQHRLKSRGLPIGGGIPPAGSATGPVATPSHLLKLLRSEQTLQPPQSPCLGLGLDLLDHGPMQISTASWAGTVAQTLVQIPYRVSQPGQLQGPELDRWNRGLDRRQPAPG